MQEGFRVQGALRGIRVIELSQVLAAPFCGYQLALLGADVVKVERPDAPDCARGRGPLPELNDKGIGLTYQVQGGNKRSLALDIRSEAGRDALLRLVDGADVLIENHVTGAMEALGLGPDALRAGNPRLIYCAMTGYGDAGPKAGKGAYDNTIQAASGIIAQCGGVKPGVSFVDYAAGYSAAFAISSALVQRERTGQGCYISASMLEVAMSLMAPEVAAAQMAPDASKVKEAGIGSFETAEGVLMLGAFKPSQYRKLGACLANEGFDLPTLAAIADWEDVWAQSNTLRPALAEVLLQRTAAEWQRLFEAAGLPAERVVTLAEAVEAPQLAARGYFAEADGVTLPLAGYHMSEGGPAFTKAPPALGADSRAVLEEAGFDTAEIAVLLGEGVDQCA